MLRPAQTSGDELFDALGSPVRRDMLRLLGRGARSVGDIAASFPISRPAISRHLAILEQAGLVRHRPHGTRNVYELDLHGFELTAGWLHSFWEEAEARLRLVAENLPPKANADGHG